MTPSWIQELEALAEMSNIVEFEMREPNAYIIGSQLRKLREERGDSLRALAKRLGRSPTYLSRIETARTRSKVSTTLAVLVLAYQKGALKK